MNSKVYTGEVVEGENGDLMLQFSPTMLEELGWEPGDTIVWDMAADGTALLARKAGPTDVDQ